MSLQIISLPRRFGKTQQMMEWLLARGNRVLWVLSHQEKQRLMDQYLDSQSDEFLSQANRIVVNPTDLKGRSQKVVGIDNLDLILRDMVAPNQLGPVTITDREL